MVSGLVGRGQRPAPPESPDEPLVIVPIPALVAVLVALRNEKGAELTQAEVLHCRDKATCMTMRASVARAIAEERGYYDIDPENVWAEWQAFVADDGNAAAFR